MEKSVYNPDKKGRVIKSVSVTIEDVALIDSLNISLSGILRDKIQEIRANSENFEKLIAEREEKILKMTKIIQEQADKIEKFELEGKN